MRRPVLPSVLLAAALTLAACGGDDDPALTEPTETESVEEEVTEEPETTETASEEPEATESEDVTGDEETAAPTPDPTAVADPCADDQGREGEAFIDVDAPVAEQEVTDLTAVELVGCSNVNEANVQWELYDGDGVLLDEGFTTAECGTGCVGEFREDLDLSAAAGESFAELHVFAESANDGSQEHLTAIPLVLS
ncbi:MAG TPA: Gmad2 immunoglobulin-like domain-containing protein [Egicoccus sp.]|nr:Gmad2 immunoglobulin-like domain-containing protein [Egicoccus sp.]HSK22552.1 Gmad2 immunoglobulin-like domain-containing protein [Egicoccus sp.]